MASLSSALTPVNVGGTQYVGLHYWFENDRGEPLADPASAGAGARLTLHLRSNVGAFLTVWMSDASHPSLELTPRTDAGPEGRWTGYRLPADRVFVVPRDFGVAAAADAAERIIIFLARSQTEQVDSIMTAREKLQRITARTAIDGESVLVREVDRTTRGQIGTYVVHRTGGQPGVEIVMSSTSKSLRRELRSLLAGLPPQS